MAVAVACGVACGVACEALLAAGAAEVEAAGLKGSTLITLSHAKDCCPANTCNRPAIVTMTGFNTLT